MSLSTHQMGQSSWEDDSRLANQEIHHSLPKSVVNYTFHNGRPLDCALSQTNARSKFTIMISILILYSCFRPAIPTHPLSFSFFFQAKSICNRFRPTLYTFCFRRSKKKIHRNKIFNFHYSTVHLVWHVLRNEIRLRAWEAFSEVFARESFKFYTSHKVILHSFHTSQFLCSLSCHCLPSV